MTQYAFLATNPCGCHVATVVDDAIHARAIRRQVINWLRGGLTVSRVPVEYAREVLRGCKCGEQVTT